mmetsp:Transcript_57841/g.169136  ORF Transcript_57841/g.169136 Transcript_57841/m.169136 type:complete len:84 (+) Transcript_57841:354-605(+)
MSGTTGRIFFVLLDLLLAFLSPRMLLIALEAADLALSSRLPFAFELPQATADPASLRPGMAPGAMQGGQGGKRGCTQGAELRT